MKILVTGAAGMLGSALCPTLTQSGHKVFATDLALADEGIEYLDVRVYEQVEEIVGKIRPDMVMHLAAETDVDKCELEPDHAFLTNTIGLPNVTLGTPSSLQPLYEYRFSIQDSMNWESLLTFSVSNASISGNNSQINTLQINGVAFNVDKPAMWDSNSTTFKYQLLFELWIYNSSSSAILYNNRYVNLQLNLISNADSG